MDDQTSTETIIMAALSTLTSTQLLALTNSISSLSRILHRRLFSLLSIPSLFSLTLHHLQSLSLQQKSVLIGRHLLSYLKTLTNLLHTPATASSTRSSVNLRDIDAAILLLLLCEIRQLHPELLQIPTSNWRFVIYDYVMKNMLSVSSIESSGAQILIKYVDMVDRCKKFLDLMEGYNNGGGVKCRKEVATSAEAIVALPSVEVYGGGKECVICKEGISEGRDVCKLPCEHLFHWICILPWLTKRNTCPCCRHRLPTDDVYGEIERLWEVMAKVGANFAFPSARLL